MKKGARRVQYSELSLVDPQRGIFLTKYINALQANKLIKLNFKS